jgi:hypothetical protein
MASKSKQRQADPERQLMIKTKTCQRYVEALSVTVTTTIMDGWTAVMTTMAQPERNFDALTFAFFLLFYLWRNY